MILRLLSDGTQRSIAFLDDTREGSHDEHVVKFEDLLRYIAFLSVLVESPADNLTRIVDTSNRGGRLAHSGHRALGETLLFDSLVESIVGSVLDNELVGIGEDVLVGLSAGGDFVLQVSQTSLRLSLGLVGDLNDMEAKRGLHHTQSTHGVVDDELVEVVHHLTVGEPIQVTALAFARRVVGELLGQLGKQLFVLGIILQLVQNAVGLGLCLFFGQRRFTSESTFIADEDMAGLQRVGTVLLVDNAHQVEGILILVRTKHETDTVAILEDGLFDGLRHILLAHPSAVVALVGVSVDVVHHVFGVDELFSHVNHMLQGILTVFLRRLDFEDDILDVASFVRLKAVLILFIESLVVGIGDDHRRIGDGGITQHDDVGCGFRILVLVVFLSQGGGDETGSLHQVAELGIQTVLLQFLLKAEPTVVIFGRKLVEVLEVIQHALLAIVAVGITEALHHPLMRVLARHLVVKFFRGDAYTCSLVFLGHEVVLNHFFQRVVVDAVSLGGRKVVVVGLGLSVLKVLVLKLLKVPHRNLVTINRSNDGAGASSLTLEKVLQDKR